MPSGVEVGQINYAGVFLFLVDVKVHAKHSLKVFIGSHLPMKNKYKETIIMCEDILKIELQCQIVHFTPQMAKCSSFLRVLLTVKERFVTSI